MSSERHEQAVQLLPGGASSVREAEEAVVAVFDATSLAWQDGDAARFAGRYAEDATVILPGFHLRGRDDVRASMAAAFTGPLSGTKRVHTPQSIRFLGTDVAVVVTRSVTVFPGQIDPPADAWELATWTLVWDDGGWLVEAYHSCPAG